MAAGSPRKKKPLPKRHQPKEPVPPFKEGDVVRLFGYFPLFYTINEPVVVLRCEQHKLAVSGWAVIVNTSVGEKALDSKHFTHDTDDSSLTA